MRSSGVISVAGPLSAVTAGFVTVLVGFTSSAAVVFQAARAAGASDAEITSWILALGIGMGVTCIGLSLRYRSPVVTAWSTPGAALLATSLSGVPMSEAIGAFLFSAALVTLCGVTGWFERVMDRVPVPLASALLAGVLVRFGMNTFALMHGHFGIVFPMFAVYLLCKRLLPRYAIVLALATGVVAAAVSGQMRTGALHWSLARPVFVAPSFSWQTLVSVGIPLFVVTMASQNIPGVAAIRGAGYSTPVSPLISWTGAVTLVLAPFGCFSLNLAAITAAICMGEDVHEDPGRRYWASVAAGVFYLLIGVSGATIVALLAAFPMALVVGIAGLGLLGTIAGSLTSAMGEESLREPALITFLTTASGVTLLGIGSALWGLLFGALALAATKPLSRGVSRTVRGNGAGNATSQRAGGA